MSEQGQTDLFDYEINLLGRQDVIESNSAVVTGLLNRKAAWQVTQFPPWDYFFSIR
jgi:hypothetical protein